MPGFSDQLKQRKKHYYCPDELEHVRSYLMIQHMRFKNKFTYEIQAEEE